MEVSNILQQPYDKQRFKILLKDLFEERLSWENQKLIYGYSDQQKLFVGEGALKLGTVKLEDGKRVAVMQIQQISDGDPRVSITKAAFKLLSSNSIDYALISFYSADSAQWRLSLLHYRYNLEEFTKDKSNPKRFSFLLGYGEKTKTPERQFSKSIHTFDDLVDRFDVEVVRDKFFQEYLEVYVRLYIEIQKDQNFVNLLKKQKVDIVSFAKGLLGKIVFLYFVQKKGWLCMDKDKEFGQGSKNFMRELRDDFQNNEKSATETTGYFYNDYLEWLFFAGLNQDRRGNYDYFHNLKIKIPYLNGGLFRKDYKGWQDFKAKISNDIFSNKDEKGDEADGILDIFDRYNFTVDEDSIYDKEIAVDPEMLGRLFEKMISISSDNIDEIVEKYNSKKENQKLQIGKDLNKKFGAFYTPRKIVHYMTRQSLQKYLINNIKGARKEKEDKLQTLFKLKDNFLSKQDLETTSMDESVFDAVGGIVEQVDEALQKVKIIDPAVGSGAFPMGLLHEVSSIRFYIYEVFYRYFDKKLDKSIKDQDGQISMYQIKRHIIENNIYGVDIDPGAIDIARLRFWLSLVVDEKQPEPLPNFEFTFVCADTLRSLSDKAGIYDTIDKEKLRHLMRQYYNAETQVTKDSLKQKIKTSLSQTSLYASEREQQLQDYKPFDPTHSCGFFNYPLMLGLAKNEKFDIVIGNPPYIQLQKNSGYLADRYKDENFKSFARRGDIYSLFYEYSLDILKQGGISTMITSNKWMRAGYGKKLRKYFVENTNPRTLIDLGAGVFDNATVDSNILMLENKQVKQFDMQAIDLSQDDEFDISKIADQSVQLKDLSKDNWVVMSPIELDIKNKIEKKGMPLKEWDIKINFGIKTGYNKAFIIDEDKKDELIAKDPKSAEIIKPLLKGKDIKKYGYEFKNRYLIVTKFGSYKYLKNKYPFVYKHLSQYKDQLSNRGQCTNSSYNSNNNKDFEGQHHWLELDNNPTDAYLKKFEKEKILFSRIVKKPQFAYSKGILYGEATCYILSGDNVKFLLALLNSPIIYNLFYRFYAGGGIDGEIKIIKILDLPIPKISKERQQPFIEKADKMLELNKEKNDLQSKSFVALVETDSSSRLKDILTSDQIEQLYTGRASKLREIKVTRKGQDWIVQVAKSSNGYYDVYKLKNLPDWKGAFIKYYLEDLTSDGDKVSELDDKLEGKLYDKVASISMPDLNSLDIDFIKQQVAKFSKIPQRIQEIDRQIEAIDKKIDEMVYELYGLSKEEIEVVERGLGE